MTSIIKFKQPRLNVNGKFIDWFYWGFIDGGFTSPIRHDLPNCQYIGFKGSFEEEIYEGDRVLYAGLTGVVIYDRDTCSYKVKSDGKQRVKYQSLLKTRKAQIRVLSNIYDNLEFIKE